MSTKHTPGPWTATANYGRVDAEPYQIWCDRIDAGIAHVYARSETGSESSATQAANTRLMAAAPDLLQALTVLLFACRDGAVLHRDHAHEQARAAIAKATNQPAAAKEPLCGDDELIVVETHTMTVTRSWVQAVKTKDPALAIAAVKGDALDIEVRLLNSHDEGDNEFTGSGGYAIATGQSDEAIGEAIEKALDEMNNLATAEPIPAIMGPICDADYAADHNDGPTYEPRDTSDRPECDPPDIY